MNKGGRLWSAGMNLAAAPIFNKLGYPQLAVTANTNQAPVDGGFQLGAGLVVHGTTSVMPGRVPGIHDFLLQFGR